ncbi:hypothetical protein [Aliarcobacter cryaerophilus]|uniref:hypothetical protein n=1 Tax=Aliarcobacter cryaerophilus TaxID=28198 RepID=UPI0008298BD1|nr:hypothetical protein [Aliarcobacter cryaerophilus]
MILDKDKYKKLLVVLSTFGILSNFSYANAFKYNSSSTNKVAYNKIFLEYKEVNLKTENIKNHIVDNKNVAINIAKKFAPVNIEEIVSEQINDEMGNLLVIKVYLDYSTELKDEEYLEAATNANKEINSENILVKYL